MSGGLVVRTGHTAEFAPDELHAMRRLLDEAFADDPLTEDDWEHCLGGLHAVASLDGRLVGHAALVQRRLVHADKVLRCGYVEGVAVSPDVRRRGVGSAVMAPLEDAAGAAYALGALSTTEAGEPFYLARGWQPWRGPTSALTPAGVRRTPDDDDAVLVWPVTGVDLDLDGELTCDWREGDPW